MTGPRPDDETVRCSAKGCRAQAAHLLVWNNPKVHAADREKTWVACDAHAQSLSDHLDVRGFLRRVEPLQVDGGDQQRVEQRRLACPTCGTTFPSGQSSCPVCTGVRTWNGGSRD